MDDQSDPARYRVIWISIRCPRCDAKKPKTDSVRPPIRYHNCQKCGLRFQSLEIDMADALPFVNDAIAQKRRRGS